MYRESGGNTPAEPAESPESEQCWLCGVNWMKKPSETFSGMPKRRSA